MFIDKYKKIISNGISILTYNKHILVINETYKNFIKDEEILYKCTEINEFNSNEVIDILFIKKDIKSEKVLNFINERKKDLIGMEIITYSELNDYKNFCSNIKFADMYGINKPEKVRLCVIETFDNIKDFDNSKDNEDNIFYGIWNIEKNEISTSFVWQSQIQTKMCFPDFGKYLLSIGSKFVKIKVTKF